MFTWLAAQFARLTTSIVKDGVETVNSAVEIPKTIIETEKAKLEVEQLKEERSQHHALITPATFNDVKEFDPKYQRLTELIRVPLDAPAARAKPSGNLAEYALYEAIAAFLVFVFCAPKWGMKWGIAASALVILISIPITSILRRYLVLE